MIIISFWFNELGMKESFFFFFPPGVEGFCRSSGKCRVQGLGGGRVGRMNAKPQHPRGRVGR